MISVCIWGMPQLAEKQLTELAKTITNALRPDTPDIYPNSANYTRRCVFFQRDMMEWGLGEELLIEVKGIRMAAHQKSDFVYCISETIRGLVQNCHCIEWRIQQDDSPEIIIKHW